MIQSIYPLIFVLNENVEPFQANVHFLYSLHHKTSGLPLFSGSIERKYWPGIVQLQQQC